jgi:hypothetical protein
MDTQTPDGTINPWASSQYDTWQVTLTVQTKASQHLTAGGVKAMVSGGIDWAAENYEPGFSWLAGGIKVTPAGHESREETVQQPVLCLPLAGIPARCATCGAAPETWALTVIGWQLKVACPQCWTTVAPVMAVAAGVPAAPQTISTD